jgi:hypothetical protein
VASEARRQRRRLGRSGQLGSGSDDGGGKKQQQSTKNSGGNSDGNGLCNDLRYTAFFEQSIPVWNRLTYPTYVGIQYWKKCSN